MGMLYSQELNQKFHTRRFDVNYKATSIDLLIIVSILCVVFVHLTIKISNLKEENELLRNNYNTMQISQYQDLYEDKYVTQDIKRSMKRITKGWEG